MAGSRRWFRYVADDGTAYAIERDESNVELVNLTADTTAAIPAATIPSNLSPRRVTLTNADSTVTRSIPILTLARYTALNGTPTFALNGFDVDDGENTNITSKTGEKLRRIPRTIDSGKNDGDNP